MSLGGIALGSQGHDALLIIQSQRIKERHSPFPASPGSFARKFLAMPSSDLSFLRNLNRGVETGAHVVTDPRLSGELITLSANSGTNTRDSMPTHAFRSRRRLQQNSSNPVQYIEIDDPSHLQSLPLGLQGKTTGGIALVVEGEKGVGMSIQVKCPVREIRRLQFLRAQGLLAKIRVEIIEGVFETYIRWERVKGKRRNAYQVSSSPTPKLLGQGKAFVQRTKTVRQVGIGYAGGGGTGSEVRRAFFQRPTLMNTKQHSLHKRHLPPRLPLLHIPWARPRIHATPFRPRLIGRRIPLGNESPPIREPPVRKASRCLLNAPVRKNAHSHELPHR